MAQKSSKFFWVRDSRATDNFNTFPYKNVHIFSAELRFEILQSTVSEFRIAILKMCLFRSDIQDGVAVSQAKGIDDDPGML